MCHFSGINDSDKQHGETDEHSGQDSHDDLLVTHVMLVNHNCMVDVHDPQKHTTSTEDNADEEVQHLSLPTDKRQVCRGP